MDSRSKQGGNTPQQTQSSTQIIQQELKYSGPIPPASELEAYERAIPGLGREIVNEWKEQKKHRKDNENKIIESGIKSRYIGQATAVLIPLISIAGAIFCATIDQSAVAISLIGAGVTSVIGSIYTAKKNTEEKAE
jgi:uncharacterized membrane protein